MTDLQDIEIRSWEFCVKRLGYSDLVEHLNKSLSNRTFLVGDVLTTADKYVYWTLSKNNDFVEGLKLNNIPTIVQRYFNFLNTIEEVCNFKMQMDKCDKSMVNIEKKIVPAKESQKSKSNTKFEEGGVFIPLKNAEEGKVVVRFPPEASGYLHIGHAKAALINQHYKDHYKGKLIMRFDDTNPAKESEEFEKIILEDVKSLGITYDQLTSTSDHFEELIKYCEQLLQNGLAYADKTDIETMRQQREKCQKSVYRNQTIDENLRLWKEMVSGSEEGLKCCIRIKMDMESKNGSLRDPTIYRCKLEPHLKTGTKYKVYPTYDFACPIVDSIEGVTHTLRTSEYNDRNDQFFTILNMLGLRKPEISDYSRLSLQNTVLSKRKLTYIVNEGFVDGWDDARMPTVRGILRHGLTVEGLKEFILSQGFGRAVVFMEWDKIWAFNKKVIDPVVPRFTALLAGSNDHVLVNVKNQIGVQKSEAAKHPKNDKAGTKSVWFSPNVIVEYIDAVDFQEGTNVTFINWGNLKICKVNKAENGTITSVDAELNLDDKDFKNTQKVTWLPLDDQKNKMTFGIPVTTIYYEPLITKDKLEKEEDFKQFINKCSKKEEHLIGDLELNSLKKGDIIQLQRKGYFICEESYQRNHSNTGKEYPLVLINIPEGNKKERPTGGMKEQQKNGNIKHIKHEKSQSALSKDDVKRKREETLTTIGNLTDKTRHTSQKADKEKPKKDVLKTDNKPNGNLNSIDDKRKTRLCIETSMKDFAKWYIEVIIKSEMIEYYDVSGCYILRPWSYGIFEQIQSYLNSRFAKLGVKNAYFPLFVSKANLYKEKDHIADFSPEVAWVTKSGDSEMKEPVAIRPTSETVMYPCYAKWIQSHRDLPLKLNQWCNVVRWEFKQPTPFLRTREFLWQEGHTAYANRADAVAEVYEILNIYRDVYEQLLAIPVIKGRKTEKEKFPGADFTTTTEVYIAGSGRGIQGATSHHLGQNFSKMYDIRFRNSNDKFEYAHQNSWGITTRTIGVMVMVHGDDKGIVLPPRVADIQVVIIPCGISNSISADERKMLDDKCIEFGRRLNDAGIRAMADLDENRSPGWKFNHWELKGVPVRLEVGPRDIAKSEAILCYRYNGVKEAVPDANIEQTLSTKLDEIHEAMFTRAKQQLDDHVVTVFSLKDLSTALDKNMLILAPFCGDKKCEEQIKEISAGNAVVEEGAPAMGAKSLCIPLEQPVNLRDQCVRDECSLKAQFFTLFGRSY